MLQAQHFLQADPANRHSLLLNNDESGKKKEGAIDSCAKYRHYSCKRRVEKDKTDHYRKGPAPIEESDGITKSTVKATYGTLDSDVEDLDFEEVRDQNSKNNYYNKLRLTKNDKGDSLACCRALIIYFSKLAKSKDEKELIDLNFVESLLKNGADINFPDRHGQTILHEISRGWHPDVARFAIEHGADINKCDTFGRTPLHLAAAVDYDDMVQFLVDNGGDLCAKTFGEEQIAMHYAAKNNAASSLKVMLRLGARINDRDYKRRTPLFVAVETARTDAARFLIENGAPAGVYDSSGTPCLSLMIEKMPQIAIEAVEQFHLLDLAFRKHYYYLSFLEPDPIFIMDYIPENKKERKEVVERRKAEKKLMKNAGQKIIKKEKSYAKTPLEVIVQYNQLDIIMHPVFHRLLHVKWSLFGKRGSAKMLAINLLYTIIWTVLGIMLPRDHNYYLPFADNWWRPVLEMMGCSMTAYFIFTEITQVRNNKRKNNNWKQWRTRHMEKDLQYCHPRWPEEKQYLTSELLQIKGHQRGYFRDPWNIFEWVSYCVVLTLIITRIISITSNSHGSDDIHPKVYAIGLIVIWLRLMRSCRVFQTLGPFIYILGSVIVDTAKFSFLVFEFFIPYTVGFWIIFGGPENASLMVKRDWKNFNDLSFSVFTMTLMGDFDWMGLVAVDRFMAQLLCGSYFALAGVVCMNLYIALLSDTFARVYGQATATAVMQQAKSIITLEGNLDKFHKSKCAHYMLRECSPQEVYTSNESHDDKHNETEMLERISRQIVNRIDKLEEDLSNKQSKRSSNREQNLSDDDDTDGSYNGDGGRGSGGGGDGYSYNFERTMKSQYLDVKEEIRSLKKLITIKINGTLSEATKDEDIFSTLSRNRAPQKNNTLETPPAEIAALLNDVQDLTNLGQVEQQDTSLAYTLLPKNGQNPYPPQIEAATGEAVSSGYPLLPEVSQNSYPPILNINEAVRSSPGYPPLPGADQNPYPPPLKEELGKSARSDLASPGYPLLPETDQNTFPSLSVAGEAVKFETPSPGYPPVSGADQNAYPPSIKIGSGKSSMPGPARLPQQEIAPYLENSAKTSNSPYLPSTRIDQYPPMKSKKEESAKPSDRNAYSTVSASLDSTNQASSFLPTRETDQDSYSHLGISSVVDDDSAFFLPTNDYPHQDLMEQFIAPVTTAFSKDADSISKLLTPSVKHKPPPTTTLRTWKAQPKYFPPPSPVTSGFHQHSAPNTPLLSENKSNSSVSISLDKDDELSNTDTLVDVGQDNRGKSGPPSSGRRRRRKKNATK